MKLPRVRFIDRQLMGAAAVAASILVVEWALFRFAVREVTSHDEYHMREAVTVWIILNVLLLGAGLLVSALFAPGSGEQDPRQKTGADEV